MPPVGCLARLGGLIGEHREGAGQSSADGPSHGHPVGSSDLAVAEDEGVRRSADVSDLGRPPASRVGQQAEEEQNSSEHLDRATELKGG